MPDIMNDSMFDYDLIVIGTGPGGEGAAMQAVKGGMRVAVAERYSQIGGGCTHWGTIPSKALRHTITSTMKVLNNPAYREMGINARPTLEQLKRGTQAIIGRQVTMRQSFYDRNERRYRGRRFIDDHYFHDETSHSCRILSLQLVRDCFTRIASISTTA